MAKMITQLELKEILDYNPETGVFTWKINKAYHIKIGSIAGSLKPTGYIQITINKKQYLAHRLAWLYVYGEWPKNQIDHVHGTEKGNSINNLRKVTHKQNQQNKKCHRAGKLLGCSYVKSTKKWKSYIRFNGKQRHLGYFETELEAHNRHLQELNKLGFNL